MGPLDRCSWLKHGWVTGKVREIMHVWDRELVCKPIWEVWPLLSRCLGPIKRYQVNLTWLDLSFKKVPMVVRWEMGVVGEGMVGWLYLALRKKWFSVRRKWWKLWQRQQSGKWRGRNRLERCMAGCVCVCCMWDSVMGQWRGVSGLRNLGYQTALCIVI